MNVQYAPVSQDPDASKSLNSLLLKGSEGPSAEGHKYAYR